MLLPSRCMLMLAALLLGAITLPAQSGKSGITGVVIQIGHAGPTRTDVTRYYQGPMEIVRVSDKRQVATARSDKNGRFYVELPPGTYRIVHQDPIHSKVQSLEIVVERGKFTDVKVYADNGLR